MCAPDEDDSSSVCTRERDGYEIRVLRERPECACGCPEASDHSLLDSDCKCVNPQLECYVDHYAGRCGCHGADCSDCECDCIPLARRDHSGDAEHPHWTTDHGVRRFIRPVLMRDPRVEIERPAALSQMQAPAQAAAHAAAEAQAERPRRIRRQTTTQSRPSSRGIDPGDEA